MQDLTPELRTRLNSVERMVGWFVMLATIILIAGFGFYIYQAAKDKGWFVTKINYATSLNDATGLSVGEEVKLMGFKVGEITKIEANDPSAKYGVTVFFWVQEPYYGYIWLDSKVRINSDFLGHSSLEILKGQDGAATAYNDQGVLMVLRRHNASVKFKELKANLKALPENSALPDELIASRATNELNGIIRSNKSDFYVSMSEGKFGRPVDRALTNWCWITPVDSTPLGDKLAGIASSISVALPGILAMTNQIAVVLSNANAAVARLDRTLADVHPTITNLDVITGNLRDPHGSLGNWLIPTNLAVELRDTLTNASATLAVAHSTLDNADTNFTGIATNLDATLAHLSDLTSNLAWQVSVNTNLVGEIYTTISNTDGMIQGLKHHWLLRSAFKAKPAKTDAKKPGR